MTYRVVLVDLFKMHDPDEKWPSASYENLLDAIDVAKRRIDSEVAHAIQESRSDGQPLNADRVLKRFFSFAELPLVMTLDYHMVFDSRAYATERINELVGG